MKLIKQNPFRILGIPVNAGAKDLAANMGKKRLLDIGRDVAFPLDLPTLFGKISRTSSMMDDANTAINLPQDKVKNALFWFAQPTDPIGKIAYDHLLQGNTEKASELFGRSTSWEAKLCLSTLNLQSGNHAEALTAIDSVIEQHCKDFCTAVAGQTFQSDSETLLQQYLEILTGEVKANELYNAVGYGKVSQIIIDTLKRLAVDAPMSDIDRAIAAAKSVNDDDARAQLAAGKKLMADTKCPLLQLKQMVGDSDARVCRLCDKLAGQIFQCSVNYHNAIDNATDEPVNRTVIDECLKLARYAHGIAIGKMTRDRIQNGIDTLEEKKSKLPPAGVEQESQEIHNAIMAFINNPGEKTISLTHENDRTVHSIRLLDATKRHLQSIKDKIGATHSYYLKLSTQVVGLAMGNIIGEVNDNQKLLMSASQSSPQTKTAIIRINLKPVVDNAWNAFQKMDTFDMESDFKQNKYNPNRTSLRDIYIQLQSMGGNDGGTGGGGGGCYIATMVYGSYDHPQVMVLRGFRDEVLQQNPFGRAFVKFYYRYSPTWVEHLKNKKRINDFIRKILDGFIKIYKDEK